MTLPYRLLAALIVAIVLVLAGEFHGRSAVHAEWNKQKVIDQAAVIKEIERQDLERKAYETQIDAANDARDKANATLARLATLPHPHIVCHAAPTGGHMPQVSGASGAGAAGNGELSKEFDYDPWPEAQRADTVIEACRDFYNRWPH